jgi:hypothetical protein
MIEIAINSIIAGGLFVIACLVAVAIVAAFANLAG